MSNIHGLNNDDEKPPRRGGGGSDESDSEGSDEGRQGFFVGGSDRSGQEVLGPNRNDMAARLFDAIQRAGAEKLTPEQIAAMEKQKRGASSSAGSSSGGYRLGGHGVETAPLGGPSRAPAANSGGGRQPPQIVRVVFWSNGFTVDDGPLRSFDEPQNKAFLQSVIQKRIPPELLVPGREVDLRMERKNEEYQPPKMKAFSGKGHFLGSVTPELVGGPSGNQEVIDLEPPPQLLSAAEAAKLAEKAQADLGVDESQPTTRIQIRIPGAERPLIVRLNHAHTVSQIRNFIVTVEPSLAYRPFCLATVYPSKAIEDEDQSIKDADLLNAAIAVKFMS